MGMKGINIKGEWYVAVVVKVESKDELGRPRKLSTLYDEESTNINGGEEFLIVLVKDKCVQPDVKGKA